MRKLLISAILIPQSLFANCYIVSDLRGVSTRANSNFIIQNDGLSGQSFNVRIAGKNSSVTPDNMPCTQLGKHTVTCISGDNDKSSIEIWDIYPKEGKAAFIKSTNGYYLNGATLFVGNISSCD